MKDTDLVKCAQLDLLVELKRICDENRINYFLVGGTLIGAIRHGGFIPWDDDIDVGMTRGEYERFIAACKTDLNEEYCLYDWSVDKSSPIPFLKLKIKGTHYREKLSENADINDEIFIDIFPYDNAPDGNVSRRIHGLKNTLIKKALLLKLGFSIDEGSILKKTVYIPMRFISLLATTEIWKKRYEKNAKRYNTNNTAYYVSLGGSYSYKKEMKRSVLLKKFTLHAFEGIEFKVPEDYDTFLKEVYGNYMELPPTEQRVSRHGIQLIDLGDYKVKSHLINISD